MWSLRGLPHRNARGRTLLRWIVLIIGFLSVAECMRRKLNGGSLGRWLSWTRIQAERLLHSMPEGAPTRCFLIPQLSASTYRGMKALQTFGGRLILTTTNPSVGFRGAFMEKLRSWCLNWVVIMSRSHSTRISSEESREEKSKRPISRFTKWNHENFQAPGQ